MGNLHEKTIAVDFDGVLHDWNGEWKGHHVIEGLPLPGALDWLHLMNQNFAVFILTTRGESWRGRRAVRAWLKKHSAQRWKSYPWSAGMNEIEVTNRKRRALVYMDDRALRFEGRNFPSPGKVLSLSPWWK